MKTKIFYVGICLAVLTVIQSSILNYIKIFGIKPNLVAVFVICYSLIRGNMVEGAATGLFAGLLQDMVSGKVIGLYSLIGMFLGLALSSVNRRLYRDNVIVTVFFTIVATLCYETLFAFYVYLKQPFNPVEAILYRILPITAYNSVVSILFHIICSRINVRIENSVKSARKF